jgi:hypothetical protein
VWNAGRVYFRTYLYVDTAPTADTTLISFRPNTAAIGELRLTTTGALQIRASGVQVTITPAGIAAGIAAAGIAADGTSVGIERFFDSLSGQIQMQLKVHRVEYQGHRRRLRLGAARRLGRQSEHHRLQPRAGHRDHGDRVLLGDRARRQLDRPST